jgi:murein DD-endopeptidase MepM/ murein hydrolase activator NlpD
MSAHLKKILPLLYVFAVLITPFSLSAAPQHEPVPGGIALLTLNDNQIASSARYKGKKLAAINTNKQQLLLVGLSLNTKPGNHFISIKNNQGKKEKIKFVVKPKTYKAQYLTIKNKRKVNPYEKDMPRILSEKKRKGLAKKYWRDAPVQSNFLTPVEGRISSIFGLRRFFNEQARRPHSGLDIAAPQGTPIKAVAAGKVIESGDFFFSGNMIYIDHGKGLISLYAHMHEIKVKTGDEILEGQIIGTVGETGRVTGPHLHLAVLLNQTTVDPLLFLPQLSDKAVEYFKSN